MSEFSRKHQECEIKGSRFESQRKKKLICFRTGRCRWGTCERTAGRLLVLNYIIIHVQFNRLSILQYYRVLCSTIGLKNCRLISLSHGALLKGQVKIRQWVSHGKICHLLVAVLCHALSRAGICRFSTWSCRQCRKKSKLTKRK